MSEGNGDIAAVVLAAGASTRLGRAKQLIEIEGESLLRRTVRAAIEAGCAPVFAVLGCEAERMRRELEGLEAAAVVNQRWADGMGSSLRRGMEAVCTRESLPAGVLLLVCDQPKVTSAHLRKLLEEQGGEDSRIAASGYGGERGVPVALGRDFFAELLAIEGDHGAREVIRRHPEAVKTVLWPEGAQDVDEPEDLEAVEGW
jgi:molybdenum cofactor cytidylyltransferase